MISTTARRTLSASALVVAGMFAGMQTAEAGPYRVIFDPEYGSPFPNLGWRGEAILEDGTCTKLGTITNLPGSCNGELSFSSGFIEFYAVDTGDALGDRIDFFPSPVRVPIGTPAPLASPTPRAGIVVAVDRTDLTNADESTDVWSTPFDPVQATFAETMFGGSQAYFSLIFLGDYAELIWFEKNPGSFLKNPMVFPYITKSSLLYAGCLLEGPGVNELWHNTCGLSAVGDDGQPGARLVVKLLPEPESYALVLAGLGGLAFFTRRRSLKS